MGATLDRRASPAGHPLGGIRPDATPGRGDESPLRDKNRRVALLLVAWIAAMALLAIVVIVLR